VLLDFQGRSSLIQCVQHNPGPCSQNSDQKLPLLTHNNSFILSNMCIFYCNSPNIGKSWVLPVNPRIYHSEVVKVRKMLVNASISGFYQTIAVNDSIYQHQLVKARFI
jgi:hypothetical protein